MKKFIMPGVIIMLSAWSGCAFSQVKLSNAGLYKNENDYNLHQLSYEISCSSPKNAIKTKSFFGSSKIWVKMNDKKYMLNKKDYFGFRDCKGEDFRFYQGNMFQIIDTASFYLYKHTALEPNNAGKGFTTTTKYYFSKTPSGQIELLTVRNLTNAFPDHAAFRYAIEVYARNDVGLMDYDSYEKSYKLKYLFAKSLK